MKTSIDLAQVELKEGCFSLSLNIDRDVQTVSGTETTKDMGWQNKCCSHAKHTWLNEAKDCWEVNGADRIEEDWYCVDCCDTHTRTSYRCCYCGKEVHPGTISREVTHHVPGVVTVRGAAIINPDIITINKDQIALSDLTRAVGGVAWIGRYLAAGKDKVSIEFSVTGEIEILGQEESCAT